jgi:undecaprenyl pyrophosphate synthase
MEYVFQKHKPRWRDFISLLQLDTMKMIIRIPTLFHEYDGDIFKTLTHLFQHNPYLITFICIIVNLEPVIKMINYEDSIFLNNLNTLKTLCISNNFSVNDVSKKLCIGIIPDGNRRWSSLNDLPKFMGHFIGASRIADIIRYCCLLDNRIGHLVIYVLSYDNFLKRNTVEQSALLQILEYWIQEFDLIHRSNQASIQIIGEPTPEIYNIISKSSIPVNPRKNENPMSVNDKLKVSLLLCYDGRREIHQARGNPDDLWITDSIDAVIRTGKTRRASGFCTYQTAYSEWFYLDYFWPDISISIFKQIVDDITSVEQNYGK